MSWSAIVAVARHPSLWWTAIRQAQRLAMPGWWRQWPPVPVMPEPYLQFRLVTAYGDPGADLDPYDVVTYLRWCRTWRSLER